MITVIYKHEAEPERNVELQFGDIETLKQFIQIDTCEWTGDETKEPKDMVVLNDGDTYYEEGFGKYHSWTIIDPTPIINIKTNVGTIYNWMLDASDFYDHKNIESYLKPFSELKKYYESPSNGNYYLIDLLQQHKNKNINKIIEIEKVKGDK